MEKYKGFVIRVQICSEWQGWSRYSDEAINIADKISASLERVITKYINAFGEIPKPINVIDKKERIAVYGKDENCFNAFQDHVDESRWQIHDVTIAHDYILFYMEDIT
jgi:hypothetical protein